MIFVFVTLYHFSSFVIKKISNTFGNITHFDMVEMFKLMNYEK